MLPTLPIESVRKLSPEVIGQELTKGNDLLCSHLLLDLKGEAFVKSVSHNSLQTWFNKFQVATTNPNTQRLTDIVVNEVTQYQPNRVTGVLGGHLLPSLPSES
jgi:hypothetical protein